MTIHYGGKLKSPKMIAQMPFEVAALAEDAGWEYHNIGPVSDTIFNHIKVTLQGISVDVHPQCDPLLLVFDEQGRSVSLPGLDIIKNDGLIVEKEDELGVYVTVEMPPREKLDRLKWDDLIAMRAVKSAYTKTQFAGAETHILLCKLLHYLEKKYFVEFEVFDEGDYYHTADASRLAEKIAFLNFIIDSTARTDWSKILKKSPENAPPEQYLQDLVNYLKKLAEIAPVKPHDLKK